MRFALLFLVLCGCASSSMSGDGGGSDLTTGDTVMCPGTFPTFDGVCSTVSDCRVGNHVTSCCGSSTALGIAAHDFARFQADEAVCDAQYPGCGCASSGIMTDSGESTFDISAVQVACVTVGTSARCETYVTMPPPPGR
jgi:hypothetical protein